MIDIKAININTRFVLLWRSRGLLANLSLDLISPVALMIIWSRSLHYPLKKLK